MMHRPAALAGWVHLISIAPSSRTDLLGGETGSGVQKLWRNWLSTDEADLLPRATLNYYLIIDSRKARQKQVEMPQKLLKGRPSSRIN